LGRRTLGLAAAGLRGLAVDRAAHALHGPGCRDRATAGELRASGLAPARPRLLPVSGAARRNVPALLPGDGAREGSIPAGARAAGRAEREAVGRVPSDLSPRARRRGGALALSRPAPSHSPGTS